MKYFFIRSGGHLFRMTPKAYRTWIKANAGKLEGKPGTTKVRLFGTNLGEIADIKLINDIDFVQIARYLADESVL